MTLKLTLLDPKTKKSKTYTQDFISLRRQVELLELTTEKFPDLTESEWQIKNAEYIAKLFDNPEVTTDAILDGISTKAWLELYNQVNLEVMGIDPKEVANQTNE